MDTMQAIAKVSATWPAVGKLLAESDLNPTESTMLNALIHRVAQEMVSLDRAVDKLTTSYANGWSTVDAAEDVIRAQSWLTVAAQMLPTIDGGLTQGRTIDELERWVADVADDLMMHPSSLRSTSPVHNYAAMESNDAARDIMRLIRRS